MEIVNQFIFKYLTLIVSLPSPPHSQIPVKSKNYRMLQMSSLNIQSNYSLTALGNRYILS